MADDFSSMSDSELMAIAGIGGGSGGDDFSSMSDADLFQLAGIEAPSQHSGYNLLAGGISNMVPFNVGDELMAGIRSGVDVLQGKPWQESYDSNLEEVRQYEAAFENKHPALAIGSSIAGSAPLAVVAPSGIGNAGNIFQKLGQAAIEGAGWGAAYGFGAGEGGAQNRTVEAAKQALVGEVLSPAVTGGLSFAGWLSSLPGKASDSIRALFQNADEVAANKLAPSAEKIAGIVDDPSNPLAARRTLAEATQDPYLAQLEQQVTKASPTANDLLVKSQGARKELQREMLDELIPGVPVKATDEGGAVLRQILGAEGQAKKDAAEALFEAIPRGGGIPTGPVAKAFDESIGSMYQAGGDGGYNTLLKIQKELQTAAARGEKPFSYMHSLRGRAQDAVGAAANVGDSRAMATAQGLVKEIDSAIAKAGKAGTVDPEVPVLFEAAKAKFSAFMDTYGSGPVGNALRKSGSGFLYGESSVPGFVFNGKAETTRKLLNALPDDPAALDQARGVIRDKFLREVVNNDGNLSPGKFRTKLRTQREGLTAATETGKRLFDDEHITTLDRLADDLAFFDPSSDMSVKSLANRASAGQPTTAQALLLDGVFSKAGKFIPFGEQIKKAVGKAFDAKAEDVNRALGQAFVDRDFAKTLLAKATPERVSVVRSYLDTLSKGVSSSASGAPAATAGLSSAVFDAASRRASPDISARSSRPQTPVLMGARLLPEGSEAYPREQSQGQAGSRQVKSSYPLKPPANIFEKVLDAVKQVESSNDPKAIGPETKYGRAKGAYQFLDSTGKEYHKKLGIKEPYDPHNEPQQRKLAAAYITDLLKMFDGDMELALTAFHTGPENVRKGKIGPIGRKYAQNVFSKV